MRCLKLTFLSLTVSLVLCAPALAQSNPTASQYDPIDPSNCDTATEVCAQSVNDGVEDFADNAEQGAGAVNDAMDGTVGAADASVLSATTGASSESASSPGPGTAEGNATAHEGLASITALPETGGASPVIPCAGVCLVGCGLLLARLALQAPV